MLIASMYAGVKRISPIDWVSRGLFEAASEAASEIFESARKAARTIWGGFVAGEKLLRIADRALDASSGCRNGAPPMSPC